MNLFQLGTKLIKKIYTINNTTTVSVWGEMGVKNFTF